MKTAAVIFLLLLFPLGTTGQSTYPQNTEHSIQIGVSSKLAGAVRLSYFPGKEQHRYVITYHNLDSPHYYEPETLSLYGNEQDLEDFYNFLKKGFTSKESRIMKVGNDEKVMVDYAYSSIRIAILRKDGRNSLFFLSRKQLERLFGKR